MFSGNAAWRTGIVLVLVIAANVLLVGVVLGLAPIRDFGPYDPNHDPWRSIEGTFAERHWEHFVGSRNQKQTDFIKWRVLDELEAQRVLERNGDLGILAQFVAISASPPMAFGAIASVMAALPAWGVAAVAVANTGLHEWVMQRFQLTRSVKPLPLLLTFIASLSWHGVAWSVALLIRTIPRPNADTSKASLLLTPEMALIATGRGGRPPPLQVAISISLWPAQLGATGSTSRVRQP